MPFSTEWAVPARVVLCRVTGDVTVEEAQQMAAEMSSHVETGIAPVHCIFDVTQMGKFPASVSQINTMSKWIYHASMGWIITLNASRILSLLAVVITNMARVKHRTAGSVDEALQVLQRMDASLPSVSS